MELICLNPLRETEFRAQRASFWYALGEGCFPFPLQLEMLQSTKDVGHWFKPVFLEGLLKATLAGHLCTHTPGEAGSHLLAWEQTTCEYDLWVLKQTQAQLL